MTTLAVSFPLLDPLTRYQNVRDQAAFAELVDRHSGMVHATCKRTLGRGHPAIDDACQAVFLLLMRKADGIRDPQKLAGWLHRTAVAVTANVRRSERRQRIREGEAATMTATESQAAWNDVRPMLDAAIEKLSCVQREAIVRHYFEGKQHTQIAIEVGCSETAVKKRVSDALAHLRIYFQRRGVALPLVAIATGLSAESTDAVVPTVRDACCGVSNGSSTAGAYALVSSMQSFTAIKVGIAVAAALFATGLGFVVVSRSSPHPAGDAAPALLAKIWRMEGAARSGAFTPDGKHFVYALDNAANPKVTEVRALDVSTGESQLVVRLAVQYPPGYEADQPGAQAVPLAATNSLGHIFFTQDHSDIQGNGLWAWHREMRAPQAPPGFDGLGIPAHIEVLHVNDLEVHAIAAIPECSSDGKRLAFVDRATAQLIVASTDDGQIATRPLRPLTLSDRAAVDAQWQWVDNGLLWIDQAQMGRIRLNEEWEVDPAIRLPFLGEKQAPVSFVGWLPSGEDATFVMLYGTSPQLFLNGDIPKRTDDEVEFMNSAFHQLLVDRDAAELIGFTDTPGDSPEALHGLRVLRLRPFAENRLTVCEVDLRTAFTALRHEIAETSALPGGSMLGCWNGKGLMQLGLYIDATNFLTTLAAVDLNTGNVAPLLDKPFRWQIPAKDVEKRITRVRSADGSAFSARYGDCWCVVKLL
jgi:RNA polymerase sigma factor (sigma-70 family)